MEGCIKEDNKSLCEYDQGHLDGIEVGYEIAMQKINKIRAEIEQAKDTDFQRNRKTYNKCLEIIDKYMTEEDGGEEV